MAGFADAPGLAREEQNTQGQRSYSRENHSRLGAHSGDALCRLATNSDAAQ